MPKVFTSETQKIGEIGENIAVKFLVKHDFSILDRNYTKKWGEIDIVAEKDSKIDTLVLGCTHYPLLRPVLERAAQATWGHPVTLVDSAQAMSQTTRRMMTTDGLLRGGAGPGELTLCVTDASRLDELAPRFLAEPLGGFSLVDL